MVIENGTITRTPSILNICQRSMSKLITHLEQDTGLKRFDGLKGRRAPTKPSTRFYEEIERIFRGDP